MITGDGHAKILDFGLVKLIESSLPPRTGEPGLSEVATAVKIPSDDGRWRKADLSKKRGQARLPDHELITAAS